MKPMKKIIPGSKMPDSKLKLQALEALYMILNLKARKCIRVDKTKVLNYPYSSTLSQKVLTFYMFLNLKTKKYKLLRSLYTYEYNSSLQLLPLIEIYNSKLLKQKSLFTLIQQECLKNSLLP